MKITPLRDRVLVRVSEAEEKSKGGIRFKATRQWIRVDSIQHVACFYFRLYFAEKGISAK